MAKPGPAHLIFRLQLKLHRLLHWEYWPMWTLYLSLAPWYLACSLRARSLGFFNAVNPSFKYGGMSPESKDEMHLLFPPGMLPKSILIKKGEPLPDIEKRVDEQNLAFPMIVKPDRGYRGKQVKLVRDLNELRQYAAGAGFDFLIQEYIPLPLEIGVFYMRYPDQSQGFISGIVEKKGVTITGDGIHTAGQLVGKSYRYHPQSSWLEKENKSVWNTILGKDEQILLSPIGNHARGSTFYDSSHKASEKLNVVIDRLSQSIPGFYYGRYDIKFNSWEELENGLNFKVIELNGAFSEPTHIYDPGHSYLFGLKEMARHWRHMAKIARLNHNLGHPYLPVTEIVPMISDIYQNKTDLDR